ncbi:MAG: dihydrolipoyl dehydrogenase [Deltaproteobacteria bacterium]|nr:dihydrolipoyl dehydrogenase [Deltaproteobacteria bacterium]
MAEPVRVDAVVVGSGPGGYAAGIRLGQLGIKTVVVEREKPGGVCLNVGCIPSKALIHAAKLFDKFKHASELGISMPGMPTIDMGAMQKWKDGVVGKLTSGVRQLLKANGAELLEGEASFVTSRALDVRKRDGSTVRVEAKSVVVATGSRPVEIPGFKFDQKRVIDSTGALALTDVPKRFVVVGGGYIGLELGTVYAKLGSKVTVIEALPSLLTGIDPECVQVVARKLKKTGVEVLLNAKAKGWEEKGDRAVVTIETGGQEVRLDADKILVTVGRRPNTDQVGLERIGVRLDSKGFVIIDKQQRTNVPGVYAIGDCATGPMLAHKAAKEAETCAEVIAGRKAEMDARVIPAVVFTDPEIATAGFTEEQAKKEGREVKVGKYPFAALGRALSVNETDGFAKVVADSATGEIIGVHVVGGGASDLISEAALAIEMGAFLHDISLTVHPHPTLPEAVMEAAKAALGEAIHIVNR